MAITFVNNGTFETFSFQSSATLALPGSRVNDNILIALICEQAGLTISGVSGTGWNFGEFNFVGAWAWAIVNGSEGQPTFSWSGSSNGAQCIYQFSGVDAADPIGNTSSTFANTSSTYSAVSINCSRVGSRFENLGAVSANETVSTPTGYARDNPTQSTASGSLQLFGKDTSSLSDTSGTLGVSLADARQYTSFMVELLPPGAATIKFRRTLSQLGTRMGSRQRFAG